MEIHPLVPSKLSWSLSFPSFLTLTKHSIKVSSEPVPSSSVLLLKAAKKRSLAPSSKRLQKETKKDLSRILRTEAAVKAVERKAVSGKSNRLWPKAILEALVDAIGENRWETALKVGEFACSCLSIFEVVVILILSIYFCFWVREDILSLKFTRFVFVLCYAT